MNRKIFFVAEISANHCGDYNLAKKLIKCAKVNGADAVKLQTYTADTMTIKSKKKYFKIKEGLWKGYTLWDLYDKAHTPLHWHKNLFKYGKSLGIKVFSTPFDETAVDFLEKLNCPIYKIASFEMTDLNLVSRVAKTKKPLIISTGMANLEEIETTVKTAKKNGAKDITLLYCVSNYPSSNKDFNLNNIEILKKKFKCKVGLSDHSLGSNIANLAIAKGAEVIEKHICLNNVKSVDSKFSLKGNNILKFRINIDEIYHLTKNSNFVRSDQELQNKIFRRSIYAIKDIKKGEKFSISNIKTFRPNLGLSASYFLEILNKKSPINIKKYKPLSKELLRIL